MKKLLLLSIISVGLLFASCRKDFETDPVTAPTTMADLQVPSNFDWKTTKDINLTLKGNSNGLAEVVGSKGVIYQKAFLQAGTSYSIKVAIPTYEKNLKLRFMGKEADVELDGSSIEHSF